MYFLISYATQKFFSIDIFKLHLATQNRAVLSLVSLLWNKYNITDHNNMATAAYAFQALAVSVFC